MAALFHRNRARFVVRAMVMVVNEKIDMTLKGATKAWRRIPELMYRLYASAGRCIRSRSDITESLDEPKKLGIPTTTSWTCSRGSSGFWYSQATKRIKRKGTSPPSSGKV